MEIYTLHFDGSCWPNPGGTAALGFVLTDPSGKDIVSSHEVIGQVIGQGTGMTNNFAEFFALARGLKAVSDFPVQKETRLLKVYGDSNLVIQIMAGAYRSRRDRAYYTAYDTAEKISRKLRTSGWQITYDWIPRELNTKCDYLSKAHLVEKSVEPVEN